MFAAGIETVALSATLIVPETIRFAPASSVPSSLRALFKVPVPLRVRVLFAATSTDPESVFTLAIFNLVSSSTLKSLMVEEAFTASPLPVALATVTCAAPNVPVPLSLRRPAALFTTIPEALAGKATVPAPSSVN